EIPGTGTISNSGNTVTGTGTYFPEELHVGDSLIVGALTETITSIASDTSLQTDGSFSPAVSGAAFTFRRPFAAYYTPTNVNVATITDIIDSRGRICIGGSTTRAGFSI